MCDVGLALHDMYMSDVYCDCDFSVDILWHGSNCFHMGSRNEFDYWRIS